jgi:DNA-binding response OmpR family regulator
MVRKHAPQIAFLGFQMPGMTGIECCREIKNDTSLAATNVAMVVASGNPEQVQICRDAGCDEILSKPINHDEFLAIVRRYLDLDVRDSKRLKAQIRVYYGSAPQKVLSEFSVDLSAGGLYVLKAFSTRTLRPSFLPAVNLLPSACEGFTL